MNVSVDIWLFAYLIALFNFKNDLILFLLLHQCPATFQSHKLEQSSLGPTGWYSNLAPVASAVAKVQLSATWLWYNSSLLGSGMGTSKIPAARTVSKSPAFAAWIHWLYQLDPVHRPYITDTCSVQPVFHLYMPQWHFASFNSNFWYLHMVWILFVLRYLYLPCSSPLSMIKRPHSGCASSRAELNYPGPYVIQGKFWSFSCRKHTINECLMVEK